MLRVLLDFPRRLTMLGATRSRCEQREFPIFDMGNRPVLCKTENGPERDRGGSPRENGGK